MFVQKLLGNFLGSFKNLHRVAETVAVDSHQIASKGSGEISSAASLAARAYVSPRISNPVRLGHLPKNDAGMMARSSLPVQHTSNSVDLFYAKHGKILKGGYIKTLYDDKGQVTGFCLKKSKKSPLLEYNSKGQLVSLKQEDVKIDGKRKWIVINRDNPKGSAWQDIQESAWKVGSNGETAVDFRIGKYIYSADVDETKGLVNIRKTAKAKPPKTILTPEKERILDNANFNEKLIGDLKLEYPPHIVDEVLEMVLYMDKKIKNGTVPSRNLLYHAIEKFSKSNSTWWARCQEKILADHWGYGYVIN